MKASYIKYRFAGIVALLLCTALAGCVKEVDSYEPSAEDGSLTLYLNLDIPGLPLASRAMSEAQESAVDYSSVQVLVFEDTPGGEVFRHKGIVTQSAPPTVTVSVPTGKASEKYRLVLIANMPGVTIPDATPKETALNLFLFNCVGKWSTSANIPMWGESASSFPITKDRVISMLMHRALARVDVGTLFKFNNPDPVTGQEYENRDTDKESVWGLDHFKIAEVRVYRTLNEAYAASSADRMSGSEVVVPNIPASAQFNSNDGTPLSTLAEADDNPLVYTLSTGGSASYVREIYIPESLVIDAQSDRNNVPCLVVGGYYGSGNTSEITYYRADFAVYGNGAVVSYNPILRNHRYAFDIRSVSGPGTVDPKEALNSVNVKLDLDIVEWNEVPLNFYANKRYYFDIESRTVTLEAQTPPGETSNSQAISYSTDLNLDGSDPAHSMTYAWDTGGLFGVGIDYGERTITLTALSDNVGPTASPRTDILTINVEDLQFTVYVTQEASNLDYSLDCESVQVSGKYTEGVTLNYSHYISLVVTSAAELDGSYAIHTLEKNGIYFTAEGSFSGGTLVGGLYEYPVILQGNGTLVGNPDGSPLTSFDVEIVSNSTNNSSCTARILVGYNAKRILTIGANAAFGFGYMLEPNSASRAFMDASVNFGPNPESTVTMNTNESGTAFTIKVMTAGSGMDAEVIRYADLLNNLNTFQPDIILTGQAVNYFTGVSNTNVINLLNEFVTEGGVFLMCNEYYPNVESVNTMVKTVMEETALSGNNRSIGYNQVFLLSSGVEYEDDMILNGPFGDMRGRQWGADGHEMHGFNNLPTGTIIYSRRDDDRVNMFRHPTKGFFFMGEGGFISNSGKYIGGAYQGAYVYFPFAIDAQYRPIPRTNYTNLHNQMVFNSQIFGNIIAWAVDYSERYGITYVSGENKF